MRYAIALVLALLLNATANLMMKFGAVGRRPLVLDRGPGPLISSVLANWTLIAGITLFAANVVLYTYALTRIPISLAYPIMVGSGFAIIAVVASIWLSEALSVHQWAGIVFILLGVWLVARDMRLSAS